MIRLVDLGFWFVVAEISQSVDRGTFVLVQTCPTGIEWTQWTLNPLATYWGYAPFSDSWLPATWDTHQAFPNIGCLHLLYNLVRIDGHNWGRWNYTSQLFRFSPEDSMGFVAPLCWLDKNGFQRVLIIPNVWDMAPNKITNQPQSTPINPIIYPLVIYHSHENGPFIDGLPIKNGDFPWLC